MREHHAGVYRSAARVLRSADQASDVAQSVFLKLLAGEVVLDDAREEAAVLRWWAVRMALAHMRGETSRRSREDGYAMERGAQDERSDPARTTEDSERRNAVARELHALQDELRIPLALRFLEGMTFKDVIRLVTGGDDSWTRTRAVHALQRACETVAYAHSRGVLHRDLKPANIMVGAFGETYVMDWGLAKAKDVTTTDPAKGGDTADANAPREYAAREIDTLDSSLVTLDGDVIGTPAYMPPEQARGEIQRVGPPSDVYSMGAILYHLLSGRAPYESKKGRVSARTMLDHVLEGPPTAIESLAPDAPAELVAIAEKAMRREPEARYGDMIEMAEDLRSFLEQRVVKAYRTGPVVEIRKWVQRNRGLAASLGALVLIIIGALAAVGAITATKNRELFDRNADLAAETARSNRARALAEDRADQVFRLSDLRDLAFLEKRAASLWPARPHNLDALREWVADADELAAQIPVHRESLERLQGLLDGTIEAESDNEDGIEPIPEDKLRWWLDTEERLLTAADKFFDSENGLYPGVKLRLEIASTVGKATVDDHVDAWNRAAEEVRRNPVYGGLELKPIVGLVPLGADPESGLQEFWFWESGAAPEASVDERGRRRFGITPETCLVFVLIPGGSFRMGLPEDAKALPGYEKDTMAPSMPAHEVALAPFLMSKYEITQGQWLRLTGSNPSTFYNTKPDPQCRPVEGVSWKAAGELLGHLDLALPTEAQWEYATRAGTLTNWFFGDDETEMVRMGNVSDRSHARVFPGIVRPGSWNDGHARPAPIGSFEPNPFGLYDVHGNIAEWCRDQFLPYDLIEARPLDGFRSVDAKTAADPRARVCARGASFHTPAIYATSWARHHYPREHTGANIGIRPIVASWPPPVD